MRFFWIHLGMAAWLLLSAFVLGHAPGSAALTGLVAALVGTFSFAAISLPSVRMLNGVVAIFLAGVALFSTDSSGLARGSNALLALAILALSAVPGRAWGGATQPRI